MTATDTPAADTVEAVGDAAVVDNQVVADRPVIVDDAPMPSASGVLLRRTRLGVVAALAAVAVVAPALLFVAQHPRWWVWLAQEQTPMTWLQSTVLVLVAAFAAILAFVAAVRTAGVAAWRSWLVLAAGFSIMALDERFAVHERVRDRILAPREVSIPFLPWVAPGDFLMLLLAVVGVALLPSVWRTVRTDRFSSRLFVAAVALSLFAVGIDSIDPEMWSIEAERVQQSGEEVVELAAGLAFLGAVATRLLGEIAAVVTPVRTDRT